MIYSLAGIFDIGISVSQAIRSLGGLIASLIYNFIMSLYNIFEILAIRDFMDSKFVNQIYTKVGLILGLFMVFKLSFVLVQSLIDPSKMTDKKNGIGSIIGRVIISIVLLGITPTIFKEAFRLQNLLIGSGNSDNIIYKLIVGNNITNKENFGTELSKNLFFEFYADKENPKYNGGITMFSSIQTSVDGSVNTGTYIKANNFDAIKDEVSESGSFTSTAYYLALTDAYGAYYIEFDFLGSCIVGIVIAWILLSFCIQIAIRVFKLAFLQLVAPIPILSYISDPEGSFKKWTQQCGTTFIDLFIRLLIIYFVIYFSQSVLEKVDSFKDYLTSDNDLVWVKVFLIIGLLMFAKRVPELLKDIFPSTGKFDLGIKSPKKMLEEMPGIATMGAGFVGGAAAGALSGFRHGEGLSKIPAFFGGALRGGFGSAKTKGNVFKNIGSGLNNVRAANERAYQRHHDGSTFFGRMTPVHAQRTVDDYERELDSYTQYDSIVKIVEKEVEKNSDVQAAILQKDVLFEREKNGGAPVTAAEIQAVDAAIKTAKQRALADEMIKIRTGAADKNNALEVALRDAEKIRSDGVKKGYAGYGKNDVTYDATEFNNNKKSSRAETNNIKNVSGSRHKDYEEAKANSKYGKKGK